MKRPFRHFRAEFNGKYLYSLVACPNHAVQDILDELVYQTLVQWKLDGEISSGELAIRDDDLIGIAKIAGFFLLRFYGYNSLGSIVFSKSHMVEGRERSERGLLDMVAEKVKYVREEYDDYSDDIVTEASDELRMDFIPEGAEPVGYLPYGTSLFTQDGNVIGENLLSSPPADGTPYTTYYGNKFLTHEEPLFNDSFLTIDVFKALFECAQRIRFNGPSIASFMDMTRIVGAGLIRDIEITPQGRFYLVHYRTQNSSDITNAASRLSVWLHICAQKFKLLVPIEIDDTESEE